MTIPEFIREQAEVRANAALALVEPLEINGIKITAGCTKDGIEVEGGIGYLAKILGCEDEIQTKDEDYRYDDTQIHRTISFYLNGTRFYKTTFVKKENINDGNDN